MLNEIIENVWNDRSLLNDHKVQNAIKEVIESLNEGKIRVAEPTGSGWKVNEWVKKAVILYFPMMPNKTIEAGPFEYFDKIAVKTNFEESNVRVVPNAVARYGSYLAKGVILMPSYVNI